LLSVAPYLRLSNAHVNTVNTVAALACAAFLVFRATASAQRSELPVFRDVAASAGLDVTHLSGASDQKFLPEILGSGGLFFDFDDDGWLDIFLVDGGSFADPTLA